MVLSEGDGEGIGKGGVGEDGIVLGLGLDYSVCCFGII